MAEQRHFQEDYPDEEERVHEPSRLAGAPGPASEIRRHVSFVAIMAISLVCSSPSRQQARPYLRDNLLQAHGIRKAFAETSM
jgi:hypothetical protein